MSHLAQRRLQRSDQHALRFVEGGRRRLRQCGKQSCETACLHGGRAVEPTRSARQPRDQLFDCCPDLGWRRFGINLVRVDGILEKKACVIDERELGVLILGNEALQRPHLADLGQLAQALGDQQRLGEVAFEHVDRVWGGVGVVHQLEQCRNGFGILSPEIERIEVEAQICEQRQAKNRCGERPGPRSGCAAFPEIGPRVRAQHNRSVCAPRMA
jgi:hypothetical protein